MFPSAFFCTFVVCFMTNTLKDQKKAMVQFRYIATFMMLLFSLVVLGDFAALTRRGLTNSSSIAAVHMSDDVTVNESRAEDRITSAGGKQYFRGRKMKEVKVAVTTGDAEIYSRSRSLGYSPSTEDPGDTTLNSRLSGPEDTFVQDIVTEGSETQFLHGSQLHHTLQSTPPPNLVAAATEIFNMMNKDYHSKARRRPPINNKIRPDHV